MRGRVAVPAAGLVGAGVRVHMQLGNVGDEDSLAPSGQVEPERLRLRAQLAPELKPHRLGLEPVEVEDLVLSHR
jgi:hypothetical protein